MDAEQIVGQNSVLLVVSHQWIQANQHAVISLGLGHFSVETRSEALTYD